MLRLGLGPHRSSHGCFLPLRSWFLEAERDGRTVNVVVRSLVALALVASIFLVGVPYLLRFYGTGLQSDPLGGVGLVGIVPIALGATVLSWCALTFALLGKGTPAPFDPPKVLVASGLYRVVRNPMYLGAELVLIGEAAVFESLTVLVYAAVLLLVFHLFLVYYEEPNLRRRFGVSYESYCEAVPRWVPRLVRAKRA